MKSNSALISSSICEGRQNTSETSKNARRLVSCMIPNVLSVLHGFEAIDFRIVVNSFILRILYSEWNMRGVDII
jgi:hypothetical protein